MNEQKGFFSALFDLSFSEFITTRIIKLLFVIGIIGAVIATLMLIVSGLASSSGAAKVFYILLSPVFFILYVLFVRVWLEMILVFFRIAENTTKLVEQNKTE
ncbi:MAG: DUF4282 domain-containing protein [Sedimentisphaerales bacterium]|nr:DUF4282 domain-containing protein [Sedimentisphaerales bacterium]